MTRFGYCASCGERLIKAAKTEGKAVLLGTVLTSPEGLEIVCKKCGNSTPISWPVPVPPRPTAVILGRRPGLTT